MESTSRQSVPRSVGRARPIQKVLFGTGPLLVGHDGLGFSLRVMKMTLDDFNTTSNKPSARCPECYVSFGRAQSLHSASECQHFRSCEESQRMFRGSVHRQDREHCYSCGIRFKVRLCASCLFFLESENMRSKDSIPFLIKAELSAFIRTALVLLALSAILCLCLFDGRLKTHRPLPC